MEGSDFKCYVESSWILYIFGIVAIVLVSLKTAYNLYTHFIVYFTSAAVDYRRFGRWALVTGATDGIGKALARELARMGVSIVLVSRNPEKLRRVAREIESEFRVEVQCVAIDFTRADNITTEEMTPSVYDVITEAIRDLDIGILVNNVGMSAGRPNLFLKCFNAAKNPENLAKGIPGMINCNILSQVKVTELVLPGMLKHRKGLIINISSASAQIPLPSAAIYAGSKKFNDNFSRALSYEYEDQGIIVQSIQPGFVHTKLANEAMEFSPGLLTPAARTYSTHTVRSVGKARMTHGYWIHAVQIWVLTFIPEKFILTYLKLMRHRKRNAYQAREKDKKYK